jgi:Coenzyme PQQ synthesis protein D (PqqD)
MRERCARIAADDPVPQFPAQTSVPGHGTSVADASRGVHRMNDHRFRASAAVRASSSADGLVLLDIRGGLVLASNPVGARIWRLIDEQRTVSEIASEIARDHHIPVDQAIRDVSAFVDALVARDLIVAEAVE